jgi:hypothetical protein
MTTSLIAVDVLSDRIYLVRGQRVMLDSDLAELYGVATKVFNQAIKRNIGRFPSDFMFQLVENEDESLRSQSVTLKPGRGQHRKYLPYVFTEHGAIMAASVLNSPRAVEMSVFVVRAFVQLRALLASSRELSERLDELERKLSTHDQAIAGLIDAIRQLTATPVKPSRLIGFTADLKEGK